MRGGPAPSVRQGQGMCLPLKRRRPPRGAASRCQFSRALVEVDPGTEARASLDVQSARAAVRGTAIAAPRAAAWTLWHADRIARSLAGNQADRTRPLTASRVVVETTRTSCGPDGSDRT